jgi:hypothetical protein
MKVATKKAKTTQKQNVISILVPNSISALGDPEVIPVESSGYRVRPGITAHGCVTGAELKERFLDLPDWILERDYVSRILNNKNVQSVLARKYQDHLCVSVGTLLKDDGEYPAGFKAVIDGHHRRYDWTFNSSMPNALIVLEHCCNTMKELGDLYYHYNSGDSVEESHEIIKALIKNLELQDSRTHRTWVPISDACKTGYLTTILNYTSINQDGCIGTWKVGPDELKGRTKSMVRNDLFEKQLIARAPDLMAIDFYCGNLESEAPKGKPLFDPTMKAALMVILKVYGNEMHPNIRTALDRYFKHNSYIEDQLGKVNFTWNLNRMIRDARPKPTDKDATPESHHRQMDWRGKRGTAKICVADTVWNLECIAKYGIEANCDSLGNSTDIVDWFDRYIKSTKGKVKKIK